MRNYTEQIFLNFTDPSDTNNIHNRLSEKYRTKIPIVLFDDDCIKESLEKLDERSRLYIDAHGSPTEYDRDKIFNQNKVTENFKECTVQELADLLVKNLPQQVANGKPGLFSERLMISLHVCYAGKSYFESALNSFAADLQKKLAKQNIYVDINAYINLYIIDSDGSSKTLKIGGEDSLNEIYEELDKIAEEIDSETNPQKKQAMESEVNNLDKKIDELMIWQQPGSKLTFRWGTDTDGTPVQMVFDAYELKKYENYYYEIQNAIQELRTYAGNQNEKPNCNDVISILYTLADAFEDEAKGYFYHIDKSEERTSTYKKNCQIYIDSANRLLKNNPDSIPTPILEKIIQAMTSLTEFPTPLAQSTMKQNHSYRLFPNKTKEKQNSEHLSETLEQTISI